MGAIAEWSVAGTFALAEESFAPFFRSECPRLEFCSTVGSIAKRLTCRFAAGAEVVSLAGFKFDGDGFTGSYLGVTHGRSVFVDWVDVDSVGSGDLHPETWGEGL